MRRLAIIGALSVCLLGGAPLAAMADEKTEKALEERIQKLEKMVEVLTKHEAAEAKVKVTKEGEKPLSVATTGSGKLIYAKPFVSAPKATLGGYMDFEANFLTDQQLTRSRATNFDQARFIPFIYGDVTDRIKVAAEIEFEHGGKDNPKAEGEIKIEFATMDYLITEPLNFRAGLLLMPVGKFNLLHDSPLNDLTDRPLVSRLIIPSTWTEAGAGFYGTLYPGRVSKLDYELYAFNGFGREAAATTIGVGDGLRKARGFQKTDNNNNKGVVGRVAFSPFLGVEVAGSAARSAYDPNAEKNIALWAIDWTLQKGPFEVIGESAWARIEDNFSGATIGPAGMRGYYIQGNYHFLPDFLKKWAPTHFTDASTFTAVIRWDNIDTDTDNRTLTATGGNTRELQRLTLGLNFRPIEDTVFKFDYQFNSQLNTNNVSTSVTGESVRIDGNGFLFSVATYF
ncbi:MAG: hypothetical protein Q7R68_09485 [Nitrospirales bacterium]|nr:hypothetical protein [Nitrospirales bacterium]